MPQGSSNQDSNRLNEGNDMANGMNPIKEESQSNLDPASSMQVNQQPASPGGQQNAQGYGDDEEEDEDYEDDYDE